MKAKSIRQIPLVIGLVTLLGALLASPANALAPRATPDGLPADPGASLLKQSHSEESDPQETIVPGRYIVVLKDSVAAPAQVARNQTKQRKAELGFVYRSALKGYSAELSRDAVEGLRRDPRVAYVVPDRKVEIAAQTVPTGIERSFAAESEATDIDGEDDIRIDADIAIIDTGIDHEHPDLNVVGRTKCTVSDPFDEIADECIDNSGTDGNSHGTHVAGTAAAIDNGEGVVGVAPGARLWAVKVLTDEGVGWESWIVAGVDWVTATREDEDPENDIEVANMSLSCPCPQPALDDAIESSVEAGVVYAVAAGNDSWDASNSTPANNPEVITVSALADFDGQPGEEAGSSECRDEYEGDWGGLLDDSLARFSNFGDEVDVAAPGVCILSTVPGGDYEELFWWGTSMASPHVAGAAAIIASQSPPESRKDVEAIRQQIIDEGSLNWTEPSWGDAVEDDLHETLLDLRPTTPEAITTRGSRIEFGVKLSAIVNPGGLGTSYWFEYGTSAEYGQKVLASPSGGAGIKDLMVTKTLGELDEDTTYHYRVAAINSNGTIYGEDRTVSSSRWFLQSAPNVSGEEGHSSVLSKVACMAANECIAVGVRSFFDKSPFLLSFSQRWSGGTWSKVPVPSPSGKESVLEDVSCSSPTSCMAVGLSFEEYFNGTTIRPYAVSWNGSSWSLTTVPMPGEAQAARLAGVSCASASFCVAVGEYNVGSVDPSERHKTLLLSWDGEDWMLETPAEMDGSDLPRLSSVSCNSSSACTVVGWSREDGTSIERWNGSSWSSQTPPTVDGVFRSVSCPSSSYCVAVGNLLDATDTRIATWNGEKWTGQALGEPGVFLDVSCTSSTSCEAVGRSPVGVMGRHWNGTAWTPSGPLPSSSGYEYGLSGISCTAPHLCTTVGHYNLEPEGFEPVVQRLTIAPSVTTSPATGLAWQDAILNATVSSHGEPTTYQFEYGKTTSYGSKAPTSPKSIGLGAAPVEVEEVIEGLQPGTTYHFRVVASNTAGTTEGSDLEFTTPSLPAEAFGSKGSGNGQFEGPFSLATDPTGNVWIADSLNNRVQKLNSKGEYLAKSGSEGSGNGQFSTPSGIATDSAGNVWVADTYNNRIQKLDSSGVYVSKFGSSGTGNGQFAGPASIAVDSAGNVWVADTGNDRIQKFNSAGEFLAKFGSEGTGNGQFKDPYGIVVDPEGTVWVADTFNDRIQKFNSSGEFIAKFGTEGTGTGSLQNPADLDLDPAGDLWVADTSNNRVQRFLFAPEPSKPAATTSPATDLTSEGGATLRATVDPNGAATTYQFEYGETTSYGTKVPASPKSAGSGVWPLAVSEPLAGLKPGTTYHFRVVATSGLGTSQGIDREFTVPLPKPVATTEAATKRTATGATLNATVNPKGLATTYQFEYGTTTGYGTKIPVSPKSAGSGAEGVKVNEALSGLEPATTYHFRVVATSAGGTTNGADKTFTTQALLPSFSAAFGTAGSGNGQFSDPYGVVNDSAGNVWIADTSNDRIQKLNSKGEYLAKFGSQGSGNGQFSDPRGIAVDNAGNIWVADTLNDRIQKLNSSGEYLAKYGSEGTGNGQFQNPADIAIDNSGNVWVADTSNNRIQKLNSSGEFLAKFGTPGSGNGQLIGPFGLATDSSGNVWVADTVNNRIQKFNASGEYLSKFGTEGSGNGQLKNPFGVVVDAEGNVWVADSNNNRIQKFNPSGEYLGKVGAEGSGSGQFKGPTGIAIDPEGDLWIVDTFNDRVQKWVR